MMPILLSNVASAALDALGSATSTQDPSQNDPFDQLMAKIQAAGNEQTATKSNGSTVTTANTGSGTQVVSVTSKSGQTLTQSGHVSPVVLHKFLNSLFTTLKSDGATQASGDASSVGTAIGKLDAQLSSSASGTQGLVNSFSALMQNAGIAVPTGTSASSALKSFLSSAQSGIESGSISRSGIRVTA